MSLFSSISAITGGCNANIKLSILIINITLFSDTLNLNMTVREGCPFTDYVIGTIGHNYGRVLICWNKLPTHKKLRLDRYFLF